jgi:iron complex outermembrane receptor protein
MMKKILLLLFITMVSFSGFAQDPQTSEMTREQVLSMSVDELSQLPLEDLMAAMDLMGVSSMEELTNLLINKDVSSASKRVENAFDSPLASTVLTKQEIEMSGATTIEEALRMIPGVIVREKTNGNFDIHIRGLDNLPDNSMLIYSENTNTLLMIDGRPVFNYVHGGIVWETLPVGFADIDRIEIVRGPASALYGPNAVNGVINIITSKTNTSSPLLSGSAQAGTQNTYTGNIALRKDWGNGITTAVTSNYQHRERDTEEIFLFGKENMSITDDQGVKTTYNQGGFFTLDQYERLVDANGLPVSDPLDDIDELFEEPGLARENYGVNGYLGYNPEGMTNFNLSGGYQNSYVNSSTLGDPPTSFGGRISNTYYGNLDGAIGRLKLQTNYTGGTQNFATGDHGFKIDMGQFNASAEFDWQIKALNLRPGVSFQRASYDDSPYLEGGESGYLNGKKELNTLAASLRADYLAFGKLRLVAALRVEKYNYPDKLYGSWQFAGTLPIGEKQRIRAVYSRANRSSFIINSHSNYTWNRIGRMPPRFIHFSGNEDYDLMTVDMIELGYRIKPANNIVIDAEIFGSDSRNYGALMANSTTLNLSPEIFHYADNPMAMLMATQPSVDIVYQNMGLNARQIGTTLSLDWVLSSKLIAKMHATWQKTTLQDYWDYTRDEIIEMQMMSLAQQIEPNAMEIITGQLTELSTSAKPSDFRDDVDHKSTPSLWGMINLIYRPAENIEFSSYGYYLSEQTFVNQYATETIDSKFILNAQATYKVNEFAKVFLNARNILDTNSNEFAFMDNTGAIYLVGLRFSY